LDKKSADLKKIHHFLGVFWKIFGLGELEVKNGSQRFSISHMVLT